MGGKFVVWVVGFVVIVDSVVADSTENRWVVKERQGERGRIKNKK